MKNAVKIDGIIGIIDDGIRDSCMQMDWAAEARGAGDKEAAAEFEAEAQKRIVAAREWMEKNRDVLESKENADDVAAVFVARMDQKLGEVLGRVKEK